MANFIIIVDPDSKRRSQFIQTITPLLPPIAGLVTNHNACGNFYSIWSANPSAPISCVANETGASVVWGDAIKPNSSERIDAAKLKELWGGSNQQKFPYFDGFYAAAVYNPEVGLAVGADLLGTFPVYYYVSGEIALIGSSPELFRYHPSFSPSFKPAGLVGILLINCLVDGQTLWQDVRRLGAGNLLIWQPGKSEREIKQFHITDFAKLDDYSHLNFTEQVAILEQVMAQAICRHTSARERHTLMLSGGLDSRLIAGFMHRQKIDTVAFTLGLNWDLEIECARTVAKALGFQHHTASIPQERYPNHADLLVKWEHLAAGCKGVAGMAWGSHHYFQNLATKIVTGFLLDRVIGGSPMGSSMTKKLLSFPEFFGKLNRWGISPKLLNQLFRQELGDDLVADIVAKIEKNYESYKELEFKQSWCFSIYHSNRFGNGCALWRLSFGAWPIAPSLDSEVLKTATILPAVTLSERKAEIELLCTRFPELAKLPLDRNSFNIEPLKPTKNRQRLAPLFKMQQKWRRLQLELGYDRRNYYRSLNINTPGWRKVRQYAEPYRQKVQHIFQEDTLNQLLPSPDVYVPFKEDTIVESSGIKNLIVFLLWARENL